MQNILDNNFVLKAVLEVTYKCNFKCDYCFQNSLKKLQIKELDLSEWKNVLDTLWEHGVLKLTITGGEICTKKDIEKIYEYAYKKGFIINLASNFSLINNKHPLFDIIKIYKPKKFTVTLYGDNEIYRKFCHTEDGWNQVKKNIISLKNNNIHVTARAVFHKENIRCLNEIKNFTDNYNIPINVFTTIINDCNLETTHNDLNITNEQVINVYKIFNKENEIKKLFNKQNTHKYCNAGNNSIYINPYGETYLCPPLYKVAQKANILTQNFDDCLILLRKERKKYIEKETPCHKCSNYNFCGKCHPNYVKECHNSVTFLKNNYCLKNEFIKKELDVNI